MWTGPMKRLRARLAVGLDPQQVVPVAEQVRFKRGLMGGQSVRIDSQIQGLTAEGDVVFVIVSTPRMVIQRPM